MTYHVVTPDGQKYGPASEELLRQWATEGRIGPSTLLEDEEGKLTTLGELIGVEAQAPGTPTAPPPMTAPPSTVQPPGKSTTGIWVIVAIVGCGSILLVFVVLAAILFPVFQSAKTSAKQSATLSNAKQISMGILMYSTDWDDRFPMDMSSAAAMRPAVMPYVKNESVFKTLNPAGGEFLGNKDLSKISMARLLEPANTPMLYESMDWPNGTRVVAYTDGHVKKTKFNPLMDMRTPLDTE